MYRILGEGCTAASGMNDGEQIFRLFAERVPCKLWIEDDLFQAVGGSGR